MAIKISIVSFIVHSPLKLLYIIYTFEKEKIDSKSAKYVEKSAKYVEITARYAKTQTETGVSVMMNLDIR